MNLSFLTQHPRQTALVAGILALSLTPFYTLALIMLVLTASLFNPFKNSFFASYFVRVIVNFLVLASLTMLIGMYCWLVGISVHPLFVFVPFALLQWLLVRRSGDLSPAPRHFVGRDDALAIALAAVSIVVLLGSFYLPKPSLSATVQIITNGYDNTAHMSLIQTTYEAKGYVYGSYDQVKDKIAWKTLTAYPQGWHVSNAFWWKGTGAHIFGHPNISLALNMYLATLLLWLIMAVFLFSRAAIWIVRMWGRGERLSQPGSLAAFVAANLLIQMLVFWGSLVFGFATFIAALAYLVVLAVILLGVHLGGTAKDHLPAYGLSLLMISAICTAWLLPLPIVVGMFALTFGPKVTRQLITQALARKKTTLVYAAIAAFTLLPLLLQMWINIKYSPQGGNQINDDGGIFGISSLLAGTLIIATVAGIFAKKRDDVLTQAFAALVTPALLFTALIFAYQLFTIGHPSYFFTKCLAFSLCLVGLFFIPVCVKAGSSLTFPQFGWLHAPLVVAVVLAALVIGTGQDMVSFNRLLQRSSKVTTETATEVARLAENGDLVTTRAFVFTKKNYDGDVIGSILTTTAPHNFNQCMGDALWIIISRQETYKFQDQLRECAKHEPMTVITSPKTQSSIEGLDPRIQPVLAR